MRKRNWFGLAALTLASLNGFAQTDSYAVATAVREKDAAALRSLLEQRANVNAPEPDGTTALHWAAHWDDPETAALLIGAGANAAAANRYGATPLGEACINGDAALIEQLLKAGADPNSSVGEGETALMTAARTGHTDAVKALISHGANVNSKETWRGQTALMWAAAEGHPETAQLLIEHGADVNARSRLFDYTKQKRKPGSLEMIWPRGGLTPLLFAVRQGNSEVVRLLLSAGADINLADPDNTSPLVVAILNGHYDLAALLLDKGADPNIVDSVKGRSALYSAVDMHSADYSVRPPPKQLDKLDSLDIVKALVAKGANVDVRLRGAMLGRSPHDGTDPVLASGTTPFLRAAKNGDVAVMRALLAGGADPLLTTKDNTTPLMVAAGLGYRDGKTTVTEDEAIEAVTICLEHGADINAANEKGETALHGAATRGADRVVRFLADKGANLYAKDSQGQTALDMANGGLAAATHIYAHATTAALLRRLMNTPSAKEPSAL